MHSNSFARTTLFLLLTLIFVGQTSPQGVDASQVPEEIAPITYPDSQEGLKDLLQGILGAVKAGNTQKTSQFFASFRIPNHNKWFVRTFGAAEGPRLETKYLELQAEATGWLRKRIEAAAKNASTTVDVSVYQKPTDTPMPTLQAAFRAMVQPVFIYSASIPDGQDGKSPHYLGHFVYADGGFRYLDQMVLQALSTAPPMRLRVGGNVMHAKILKRVDPVYPPAARENRIQGTVRVHVIVATDGTVKEIELVSGDPALQMAAVEAVRQWQYMPTLLNGRPVEIDTLIDVTFSLH